MISLRRIYSLAFMITTPVPFYARLCLNLISITILASMLYLGQGILVPFFFSVLLATLLLPVTNYLQRKRMPKVLSILLVIFISLAVLGGIIYFLSTQISIFLRDIDTIKERISNLLETFQTWINRTFNISETQQNEYLQDTAKNIKDSGPGFLGRTVGTITESLSYLVFLPVYTFLILYYKDLIRNFFIAVFKNASPEKVGEVLYQARTIGRDYILGLLIDMTIVFSLNSIGFLIIGIKYPIFLALVAAILNLIPYIGMLIANVFTILITVVSSENPMDAVWAAVVLAVVQFIDNNFLIPMIVGNKVRINALVTIIGVVIGGTLCGVGGMFLAIPAVATLKVIFDHVSDLKPWGMVLGDQVKNKEDKTKEPIV
jgi:predicted PurR-regulated permease PerM